MARRKKLNKRVVILLAVLAFVIAVGGVLFFIKRLPKDPVALDRRAQAAYEQGNYGAAATAWKQAIGAAKDPTAYYYKLGKLQLEWSTKPGSMTNTERSEKYTLGVNMLRIALRRDPGFVDAQRMLTEVYWSRAAAAGRWREFVDEADNLLRLMPKDDQTYYRRAIAKAQLSESLPHQYTKPAIADFRKATELDRNEARYWLGLVRFLQKNEQTDEVRKVFAEAITANPNSAELRVAYAHFLRQRQMNAEAEEQIRQAVVRDPNNPLGNLELAEFAMIRHDTKAALKALQAAKAIDDSDFRVYDYMARVYRRQRQLGKAADALREGLAVIARRSEKAPATQATRQLHRLDIARWQLNYLLANVLLDMVESGQADKASLVTQARKCLEVIDRLAPDSAEHDKVAGRLAYADGNITEAVKLLERAYKGFRSFDARTAFILIDLYFRQGLPGKAERVLDRILSFPSQRRNPSALLLKARLAIHYRDFTKAERYVVQVLQIEPDNAEARNLKATLDAVRAGSPNLPVGVKPDRETVRLFLEHAMNLWLNGQRDQAVQTLEKLHQRIPDDLRLVTQLANMYLALKQPDKAEALLQQAKAAHADDPKLQSNLQFQLDLLNEPEEEKRFEMRLAAVAKASQSPVDKALQKAAVCAMFGRQEQYAAYLQEAAKIDPEAPGVVVRLFRYAMGKRDWQLADKMVAKASKADLDGASGRTYRAQLAMARDRLPEAINALTEALSIRPELKHARVLLGECYLTSGELAKAEETFRTAASNDPGYAAAMIGMARVTELQGRPAEHRDWVEKAYRHAPRNPYVRERFLTLQEEKAKPREVIKQRERILRQNPADLENRRRLAGLYERTKQLAKAEEMYRFVYDNAAEKILGARLLAGFYARTERSAQAENVLQDLLKDPKDKVGAYMLYGEYLAMYDVNQALEAFTKAIEADPKDPRGHLGMARLFASQRQWKQAAAAMEKYVTFKPADRASEKDLVRYLIEAGEWDAATKRLDRMVAQDPSDVKALILKGVLAGRQGEISQAEELLSRAAQLGPNDPEVLVQRSGIYLVKGQVSKARDDLRRARDLTNDPNVAMRLASVYLRLGDRENARLVYLDILSRRGDYAPAIRQLTGLYLGRRDWVAMESLLAKAKSRFPKDPSYLLAEAEMWRLRKNSASRITALRSALALAPQAPNVLFAYLSALLEAKQFDKTLAVSQDYTDKPDFAAVTSAFRARALAGQGKPTEADALFIESLEKAAPQELRLIVRQIQQSYGPDRSIKKLSAWMASRPNDWRLYSLLGDSYLMAGKAPLAAQSLLKARGLAAEPRQKALINRRLGSIYYNMYSAQGQKSHLTEAEKAYLESLKVLVNDIQTMNNLAYLYTDAKGQPEKALPYAEKAAKLAPNNANILDTYAWTLAKVGKYAQAENILMQAVQAENAPVACRYHLGWIYEKTKRFEESLRQYEYGLEIIRDQKDNPLLPRLQEAVARLKRKLQD
ncbi:MAG: tetratricopeptide repeat protein [Planctomycetota bacterium]|nr:tetratricopeptide repeat protein [Planctomycetota bacterium]